MTPLERGARALSTLDGHADNATLGGKPMWHDYVAHARVVLDAIREPSEGMANAAYRMQMDSANLGKGRLRADGVGIWRAMIDTALCED